MKYERSLRYPTCITDTARSRQAPAACRRFQSPLAREKPKLQFTLQSNCAAPLLKRSNGSERKVRVSLADCLAYSSRVISPGLFTTRSLAPPPGAPRNCGASIGAPDFAAT